MQALTIHLPDADTQTRVDIWDAVEQMTQTMGWAYFCDAIEARQAGLQKELLNKPVRETAAEYERTIGEMRGLSTIEGIIQGLKARAEEVQNG